MLVFTNLFSEYGHIEVIRFLFSHSTIVVITSNIIGINSLIYISSEGCI
jgi:hypothetical protein